MRSHLRTVAGFAVAAVFLWLAFSLSTVIAFFVVLFTGRYPRGIF